MINLIICHGDSVQYNMIQVFVLFMNRVSIFSELSRLITTKRLKTSNQLLPLSFVCFVQRRMHQTTVADADGDSDGATTTPFSKPRAHQSHASLPVRRRRQRHAHHRARTRTVRLSPLLSFSKAHHPPPPASTKTLFFLFDCAVRPLRLLFGLSLKGLNRLNRLKQLLHTSTRTPSLTWTRPPFWPPCVRIRRCSTRWPNSRPPLRR